MAESYTALLQSMLKQSDSLTSADDEAKAFFSDGTAELRAENLRSMIEYRRAATASRQANEAIINSQREAATALTKERTDKLNAEESKRIDAAQRLGTVRSMYGDLSTPSLSNAPAPRGKFFDYLDESVLRTNDTRVKENKGSMLPWEEYDYRKAQIDTARESLKLAAKKDSATYGPILAAFEQGALQVLPKNKPKDTSGWGVSDFVVNVIGGLSSLGASAASGVGGVLAYDPLANKGQEWAQFTKDWQKKYRSARANQRDEIFSQAQGFLDTLGVIGSNPAMAADLLAQVVAPVGVVGVGAKALIAATSGRVAASTALKTSAGTVGAVTSAGDAVESARAFDLSPEETQRAAGIAAVIGGGVSALGGAAGVESIAARALGVTSAAGKAQVKRSVGDTLANVGRRAAVQGGGEALEEGIQSAAGEAAAKLVARVGTPEDFFSGKGAAAGLITGGALGTLAGRGQPPAAGTPAAGAPAAGPPAAAAPAADPPAAAAPAADPPAAAAPAAAAPAAAPTRVAPTAQEIDARVKALAAQQDAEFSATTASLATSQQLGETSAADLEQAKTSAIDAVAAAQQLETEQQVATLRASFTPGQLNQLVYEDATKNAAIARGEANKAKAEYDFLSSQIDDLRSEPVRPPGKAPSPTANAPIRAAYESNTAAYNAYLAQEQSLISQIDAAKASADALQSTARKLAGVAGNLSRFPRETIPAGLQLSLPVTTDSPTPSTTGTPAATPTATPVPLVPPEQTSFLTEDGRAISGPLTNEQPAQQLDSIDSPTRPNGTTTRTQSEAKAADPKKPNSPALSNEARGGAVPSGTPVPPAAARAAGTFASATVTPPGTAAVGAARSGAASGLGGATVGSPAPAAPGGNVPGVAPSATASSAPPPPNAPIPPTPITPAESRIVDNIIARSKLSPGGIAITAVADADGLRNKLSAAKNGVQPVVDRALEMLIRGTMTLTTLRRVFDSGPDALLGGNTRGVVDLLQRAEGRRGQLIEESNKVVEGLRSLGAVQEIAATNALLDLNLHNKGRGLDPRTADRSDPAQKASTAKWDALPEATKTAATAVVELLNARNQRFSDSLVENMRARLTQMTEGTAEYENLDATIKQTQALFANKVPFYAAISRVGPYAVYARDTGDGATSYFEMFHSKQAAQAAVAKLSSDPNIEVLPIQRTRDFAIQKDIQERAGVPPGVIEFLRSDPNIPDSARQELIAQLITSGLKASESRIDASKIERRGIAGGQVSLGDLQAMLYQLSFGIATNEFSPKVDEAMKGIDTFLRTQATARAGNPNAPDQVKAGILRNAIQENATLAVNPPKAEPMVRKLIGASYFLSMAFTPAVGLWNVLSVVQNSLPFLNSYLTTGRGVSLDAGQLLTRGMSDVWTNPAWKTARENSSLPENQLPSLPPSASARDRMLYAVHNDLLAHGRLRMNAMANEIDDVTRSPLWAKSRQWASGVQNYSEYTAVSATAIAGTDAYLAKNPNATTEEVTQFIRDLVDVTQPTSAQYEKPIYFKRSSLGKYVGMLRTFPAAIVGGMVADAKAIATLTGDDRRIALNKFIGQHMMMTLLGGVAATPIGYGLIAAMGALKEAGDDEPLDDALSLRDRGIAGLRELYGEDVANVFRRGIIPVIDGSGSLEISPLVIFRMPESLSPGAAVKDLAVQAMGPLGGWVGRAGSDNPGDDLRTVGSWMPRSAQGVVEVMRWARDAYGQASEGYTFADRSKSGDFVTNVAAHEAVLRLLGFQVRGVQQAREDRRLVAVQDRAVKQERTVLWQSIMHLTAIDEADAAANLIAQWNNKYQKYPNLQIDEDDVERRAAKWFADNGPDADRFSSLSERSDATRAALGFGQ